MRLQSNRAVVKPNFAMIDSEEDEDIVNQDQRYTQIKIPEGSLIAVPALPEQTISTLSVRRDLVASNSLMSTLVLGFLSDLMDARLDLQNIEPLASQIGDPTIGDASNKTQMHLGAAIYFDEQNNFLRALLQFAYVLPFVLGTLGSLLFWFLGVIFPRKSRSHQLLEQTIKIRAQLLTGHLDVDGLQELQQKNQNILQELCQLTELKKVSEQQALTIITLLDGVEKRLKELAGKLERDHLMA